MAINDKEKNLEQAIAQIEKSFGKGAIMRLGDYQAQNIEVIPTGCMSLDFALGVGGVPRGRIVEIYGPESSGKTTVALHVLAEAQKLGGTAAFIDAEHALDPTYAEKLGSLWNFNEPKQIGECALPACRHKEIYDDYEYFTDHCGNLFCSIEHADKFYGIRSAN